MVDMTGSNTYEDTNRGEKTPVKGPPVLAHEEWTESTDPLPQHRLNVLQEPPDSWNRLELVTS